MRETARLFAHAASHRSATRPAFTPSRPTHLLLTLLKPPLRAYLFGHLSSTAPRLLAALLKAWSKPWTRQQVVDKLRRLVSASCSLHRFPAFCALLTGAYTLLQECLFQITRRLHDGASSNRSGHSRQALLLPASRYLAAFIAAFVTFPLLNQRPPQANTSGHGIQEDDNNRQRNSMIPDLAGKTLDLTLIATVRAVETLFHGVWTSARRKGTTGLKHTSENFISQLADPFVFASSAGIVMWAWFYAPERLPASYNRWITAAAEVDPRLISALRHARRGEWVYGQETGKGHILSSMATDLGIPPELGDPAKTIPVSCEIVHQGTGSSCHWYMAVRFTRAFRFALVMYLPLQIAFKALRRRMSLDVLRATVREAMRSSAFLGAFISLFYYSVCLARTVLGPRLFGRKIVTPQMWDSGYAVGLGCVVCGWSVMIETARRRQELALFVAPRAAATVLPRTYDRKYLWRERLAFALSIGLLFTRAREDSRNVRGMVGSLLHGIISP